MELSALAPASSGQVEVLELLWPPVPEASDGQRSCVCYVLMVRSDGFLLCVPAGFLQPGGAGHRWRRRGYQPGPFTSEEGEWVPAPAGDLVPAIVVDFQAAAAQLLSPVELDSFLGSFLVEGDPSLYPLASHTLRQARQWILAEGGLCSGSFGRTTGRVDARRPGAKRPCRAAGHLDRGCCETKRPAGPPSEVSRLGRPCTDCFGATALRPFRRVGSCPAPGTSVLEPWRTRRPSGRGGGPGWSQLVRSLQKPPLPPFQPVAKSLAHSLGPPSPIRARAPGLAHKPPDQEVLHLATTTAGELPLGGGHGIADWPWSVI